MAKLLTLAKRLDFQTETEYFDYCIDSHINGNFTQCRDLFKALTRADRKSLLQYIQTRHLPQGTGKVYNFYFNLL